MAGALPTGWCSSRGTDARAELLALPGIGPWTAEYVAMRALGDPDAWMPTDIGVRHGLARVGARAEAAEAWRPFRVARRRPPLGIVLALVGAGSSLNVNCRWVRRLGAGVVAVPGALGSPCDPNSPDGCVIGDLTTSQVVDAPRTADTADLFASLPSRS